MKYFIIFLVLIVSNSCKNIKDSYYADYMKTGQDSSVTREFTSYLSDTTMSRIFLRQSEKEEHAISKLSYVFFLNDGSPLSSGIEYYFPDNSYELIAHSLYEVDTSGNSTEAKAILIKGGRQSLNANPMRYNLVYDFKSNPLMTLEIQTEIFCKFQFVDSLNAKCLLVNTIDQIFIKYADSKRDTSEIGKTFRLYEKGKGLTRFENESNGIKSVYNFTNKYSQK